MNNEEILNSLSLPKFHKLLEQAINEKWGEVTLRIIIQNGMIEAIFLNHSTTIKPSRATIGNMKKI